MIQWLDLDFCVCFFSSSTLFFCFFWLFQLYSLIHRYHILILLYIIRLVNKLSLQVATPFTIETFFFPYGPLLYYYYHHWTPTPHLLFFWLKCLSLVVDYTFYTHINYKKKPLRFDPKKKTFVILRKNKKITDTLHLAFGLWTVESWIF